MYFTVLHTVTLISSTQQPISNVSLLASLLNVSTPPPSPPDNITHQYHVQPPSGPTTLQPTSASVVARDHATLMEEIKKLVHHHQDRFHMETFTSSNRGYHVELNVVTYFQKIHEIEEDKSKFQILLSFGQHARELITSELALKILYILSEDQTLPKRNPFLLNRTLQNTIKKVVPIENLNGRKKVEAGELCEHRNG
ncbi:hypothetical protein Lser_V15G23658 [Lactuca serriola]